ncbi:MAG: anaerobic carbon-monoxide dehydrogenase catalytic subunit [Firmicutes bacterium]|nr:anaerobic carbon-monoxide dehydrogenase catalytic subunit [Bacillota bacterium]
MGNKKSIDPAALEMLSIAEAKGISTAFSRVDNMKPCPIGADGACCKNCSMGPCRLVGKDEAGKTGICGATLETVTARNLARIVAAGASAHSDHGRDMAQTLIAVANGEARSYQIKDVAKLKAVARDMGIPTEGRSKEDIARDVGTKALMSFGQQSGELVYVSRAPKKRQELWRRFGLTPRGVDREVVESLHRTSIGVDQDAEHILDQALRTSLASGWGGSMLATDLTDILFGAPKPLTAQANLGVLKKDEVNVVVHGHEPTLSEMIVAASQDPELVEYAKNKGAKGINLAGICCTANEVLMRQGVASAGNFLHQELAIVTGAVDAMVVDVQCIFQGLAKVAQTQHTKLITTSPKAKITGATHMQFDEHHAYEMAKEIVKVAIDNFQNRGEVHIPDYTSDLVAGFSHEYIEYMLGGRYRASFRPLNDAIMQGRILGVAGIVGCNNPRVTQDEGTISIMRQLLANNVLVVMTGCSAIGAGKHGFMVPEMMEQAGAGLREVCEAVGMPPVLHLGSCVDNSRILTVLSAIVKEGGLGDDISDVPAVGIAPEWMSEKAIEIATYVAASGGYVLMGGRSPVKASAEVTRILSEGWEKKVGGKVEFVDDYQEIVDKTIEHLHKKRKALGIDVAKERELFDMEKRRELVV